VKLLALVCMIISAPTSVSALGSNQLYTGDPSTIPPGKTQLLAFTDTTHPARARLGGFALRPGLSSNADAKIAYSYLWNLSGPDAQIGPNVGLKWRFAGNGTSDPSLAVSVLYVINQNMGGRNHKNDHGATLIGLYPNRFAHVLANFGRVWVGDKVPDLQYVGLALARPVSRRALAAVEYSSVKRLGPGGAPALGHQVAVGLVYRADHSQTYSAEVGHLPDGNRVKWHMTLGVSTVF
jgi:hypothetical protein